MSKALRAFFVRLPHEQKPAVVVAASAGAARYHLYLHFKQLGPHMLRQGCGLRFYNLTHFLVHRAPAYYLLSTLTQRPRSWDITYADAALS